MANANNPRGLIPVRKVSGQIWNGAANVYFVPASVATAIFVGDPVAPLSNAGDAVGIPAVTLATAGSGNNILGAMVGIVAAGEPQLAITRDLNVFHPASTGGYILVADDPELLFDIQEDSVGGAMVQGAGNRNVNLVSGAGSTTTGYSGWQIQSSSLGTGATLQLRVIRLIEQADNAVGVNANWLVRINNHALTSTTGV